jgi:hypothetical protein
MKRKYTEIALIYLFVFALVLSGCASIDPASSIAPLQDGNALHLFRGFAQWLVIDGDALVKSFYNPRTDITVYTRPLMDGFAIACQKSDSCDDIVAYFVNIKTYGDFKTWLVGPIGGFTEIVRNLPPLPNMPVPTLILMPVVIPKPAHAWEYNVFTYNPEFAGAMSDAPTGLDRWLYNLDEIVIDSEQGWTVEVIEP